MDAPFLLHAVLSKVNRGAGRVRWDAATGRLEGDLSGMTLARFARRDFDHSRENPARRI